MCGVGCEGRGGGGRGWRDRRGGRGREEEGKGELTAFELHPSRLGNISGLGTIPVPSSCNTRSHLRCSHLCPFCTLSTSRNKSSVKLWFGSDPAPYWDQCHGEHPCARQLSGCCFASVATLLFEAFCHEVYPTCSSASPSKQLFSKSPQHRGGVLQRSCHVACLVFFQMEVRVCHVQCDTTS